MNIEAATEEFWKNGYLVIENAFSTDLMDRLHGHIMDHFSQSDPSILTDEFTQVSKCEIVPWFPQRDGGPADFDEIDQVPLLSALTDAILGRNWNNLYSMVMFSAKGTKGQAWHQDCPPEDNSRFNLNRLIYTRDIVPEIGGQVMVVPGTHRNTVLPAGNPDDDLEGQIELRPKKGTLVLLHGHTWHRVLPVTGGHRVSTNYRAGPAEVEADVTDICVYRNMRYQFSTQSIIEQR
ncbi:phytanoyl-CoA dioxygenase family protein [Pelagicoccus mobilis]|uniref:Phytanoyl-CoA dioxygenase family protein n=1 Tax=Pelagicoccus mobilis TaxID=415221 RepID=A0A934RVI0_9BACT|nr:phytanoyl-CoA dioxygenase family protein [Pelagicoccus mobilis]MBK1875581.1 phytanoyl-CoA dioxygenase family protein [Pelagicoccus mobilis]